jgi:SAM-dependent methyltransferase
MAGRRPCFNLYRSLQLVSLKLFYLLYGISMTERGAPGEFEEYYSQDLESLSDLPNYQQWIIDYFRPYIAGHGMEFGAGMGTISELLLPYLDKIDLVEPSPNLVPQLQNRFQGNGAVRVIADTVENRVRHLRDQSLDTIILVNVLEHIEDDADTLRQFSRILRPGGNLLLFVPALPFLFSDMDQVLGHHRRYLLKGLRKGVESAGLELVRSRYFDLLGILPWFLVNTLGRKKSFNQAQAQLYDRVGIPLTRTVESIGPPPIGKNVILVARKKTTGCAN